MKANIKQIGKTAGSGQFWKSVAWTGVGSIGGEILSNVSNKIIPSASSIVNDAIGGIVAGSIGIMAGKPEVAAGTLSTKIIKQVSK